MLFRGMIWRDWAAECVPEGGESGCGVCGVYGIGGWYRARLGVQHQLYFRVNGFCGYHIDSLDFQLFITSLNVRYRLSVASLIQGQLWIFVGIS